MITYSDILRSLLFLGMLAISVDAKEDPPPRLPKIVKEIEDVPVLSPTPVGALAPSGGGTILMPGQGSDAYLSHAPSSFEMNIRLRRAVTKRDLIRSRHSTGPNTAEEVLQGEWEVDLLEAQLEETYQLSMDALDWLNEQLRVNKADVGLAIAKQEYVLGRQDYQASMNAKIKGGFGYQLYEVKFEVRVANAEVDLKQAKLQQTSILIRQTARRSNELAKLREDYFKKRQRGVEESTPAK